MPLIASRDLRNHTADVLRQVADGAHVTITVGGTPVAELVPVRSARRPSLPKADFVRLLIPADPGLRDDLAELGRNDTDLPPIR